MLFYWLRKCVLFAARLFRAPEKRDVARIRANAPCPACGAKDGTIRCVSRDDKILVQHTCGECGGRWWEKPVIEVTPAMVGAAIPRTDIERDEEAMQTGFRSSGTRR